MLKLGLYEQGINGGLRQELDSTTDKFSKTEPIDNGKASCVLAEYITEIVEQGFNSVKDNGGDLRKQAMIYQHDLVDLPTGQRYMQCNECGTKLLLYAREL